MGLMMRSMSNDGSEHIVHPRHNTDEIRFQCERRFKLLIVYLMGAAAPHREVGIEKSALMGCDVFGQPIGPTDVPAVAVWIEKALGGAVSDRNVTFEGVQLCLPARERGLDSLQERIGLPGASFGMGY